MDDGSSQRSSASTSTEFCQLPEEIILHIFAFLNAQDLCHLRQVNWKYFRLADEPKLWQLLYEQRFRYIRPLLPDANGILTLFNDKECREDDHDNAWRRSYQILHKGIQIYPDDKTYEAFNGALDANPNALILLHPGLHVLRRPLKITSSARILGIGPWPAEQIHRHVCLQVQVGCSEFYLISQSCRAQLAYLTIGFRQIGPVRAPLLIKEGARPTLTNCGLTNSSQMGWALVVSGPTTSPYVRRCVVPDGVHQGFLLSEAGGRFEENEFGLCRHVCLKLVASKATFANNWVRLGNKVEMCEGRGSIGGELLSSWSRPVAIEVDPNILETHAWRKEQGWQHWGGWPTPASSS